MREQNEVQVFNEKPDGCPKTRLRRAKANLSAWMDKAEDAREVRFNEWPARPVTAKNMDPKVSHSMEQDLDPMPVILWSMRM